MLYSRKGLGAPQVVLTQHDFTTMSKETIAISFDGAIATVWLNRPDIRNALNETVIRELKETFEHLGMDPEVRAVVLAGKGIAFCAGADLTWMKRMANYTSEENYSDAMHLASMLETIYSCPKPTIARVHGHAFAGGMGLAAACDIVVAAVGAEFCLSEVRLGLTPATISPYVVRALGWQACRRYMLTAERLTAVDAHRIGFVQQVCELDRIDATVAEITTHLKAAGPVALSTTKRLIRHIAGRPVETTLIAETAALIAQVRASAEGREGVDAFLAKRVPTWALDQ